jgi:hypothetical protein
MEAVVSIFYNEKKSAVEKIRRLLPILRKEVVAAGAKFDRGLAIRES